MLPLELYVFFYSLAIASTGAGHRQEDALPSLSTVTLYDLEPDLATFKFLVYALEKRESWSDVV